MKLDFYDNFLFEIMIPAVYIFFASLRIYFHNGKILCGILFVNLTIHFALSKIPFEKYPMVIIVYINIILSNNYY